VLLPFSTADLQHGLPSALEERLPVEEITMAEACLNDGQRLLAFNDLFIGQRGHVSARYRVEHDGRVEEQSSSGILVSTGAGSTGWLSSVYNMANGLLADGTHRPVEERIARSDRRLRFIVREPFRSKHSGADIVTGIVHEGEALVVRSHMGSNGIIFSDGIEADHLAFDTGSHVRVSIARERARLITYGDAGSTKNISSK
jgi:hypothetical protein